MPCLCRIWAKKVWVIDKVNVMAVGAKSQENDIEKIDISPPLSEIVQVRPRSHHRGSSGPYLLVRYGSCQKYAMYIGSKHQIPQTQLSFYAKLR